jgi:hypothetical protein
MLYILILLALIASGSFLLASVQSKKNQELNKKLDSYLLIPTENYEKMVCLIQKKPLSYTKIYGNLKSEIELRHISEEKLIFFWYDNPKMSKEDLIKRAFSLIYKYYPTNLRPFEYGKHIQNPERSTLETVEVYLAENHLETNPLSND